MIQGAAKTVGPGAVLVVDALARSVLLAACSVGDLEKHGVATLLDLEAHRTSAADGNAVYFIDPSADVRWEGAGDNGEGKQDGEGQLPRSVATLLRDFAEDAPRYGGSVMLLFATRCVPDQCRTC